MVEAILAILLVGMSALSAIFWRKSSEARERATEHVIEMRAAGLRKRLRRSAEVRRELEKAKQEIEPIGDSRADRQALADLLNEES